MMRRRTSLSEQFVVSAYQIGNGRTLYHYDPRVISKFCPRRCPGLRNIKENTSDGVELQGVITFSWQVLLTRNTLHEKTPGQRLQGSQAGHFYWHAIWTSFHVPHQHWQPVLAACQWDSAMRIAILALSHVENIGFRRWGYQEAVDAVLWVTSAIHNALFFPKPPISSRTLFYLKVYWR